MPGASTRLSLDGQLLTSHIRERIRTHLATASPSRRTTPYLHSLVMRLLLEEGVPLAGWTYRAVEELCALSFQWDGARWQLGGEGGMDEQA